VLQPISVRRNGDVFEIIAGERRTRTAQLAGRSTIPALIREGVTDGEMLELALVENIQRADLNPLEKAQGFKDLMTRLGLSQEQVAERVGVKRSTVANHLRLLELPETVQRALIQDLVTMGHAKALLALPDSRAMERVLEKVVREGLSVRQVEGLVRRGSEAAAPDTLSPAKESSRIPPWVSDCEQRLRDGLGTKVRIVNQPGYRGQIVVEYFSKEELERLLECLAPRSQV
jgi:ParB family chromosome partitioning protein